MGELWGITADGWIAIATFAGGLAVLAAIVVGAKQVLAQLEAGDVRRYVFDEGVLALKRGLDDLLELTRLNYALLVRLLKHMQSTGGDRLARLRPDEIPRALPDDLRKFNAHAIGPAGELIGSPILGELMTRAFAQLYSVNVNFEIGLRQRILNYYADEMPQDVDIESWIKDTLELAQEEYLLADESYLPLSALLLDAVNVAQRRRLRRFRDIPRVCDSKEMREIAGRLDELSNSTNQRYEQWLERRTAQGAAAFRPRNSGPQDRGTS